MSSSPEDSTTASNASGASDGDERRRFPRVNCAMALDVALGPALRDPSHQDDALQQTITINLSVGGLCFYSDILYPIGSQVFCRLSLPDRDAPLDVRGSVVWFQKVEREEHGYKLGVEFGELSSDATRALEHVCAMPPTASQGTRAKRLLLVEDDHEMQRALKLRFEAAGFEVITANEGLEALRMGRENHPQAILLDLMLPKLNGYEVCRLLKFDQKFSHIPIIVFTARSRREDMELGFAAGADAYITKPFDGKALIAKINELLTERREQRTS